MATAAERLRDGLRAARLVERVELSQPRRLRFKPGPDSCVYCGWPHQADLEAEDGVGLTCTDVDSCLSRHEDCSDAPHPGWLEPFREQADAAELALSQLEDLVILGLTAEHEDEEAQTPAVPEALLVHLMHPMLSDPSQRGHLHSEHRHQLRPLGLDRAHTEGARQARMSGQVPPEPDGQDAHLAQGSGQACGGGPQKGSQEQVRPMR
jgi:hypothetical protein